MHFTAVRAINERAQLAAACTFALHAEFPSALIVPIASSWDEISYS